jgi:hypothetical protein
MAPALAGARRRGIAAATVHGGAHRRRAIRPMRTGSSAGPNARAAALGCAGDQRADFAAGLRRALADKDNHGHAA